MTHWRHWIVCLGLVFSIRSHADPASGNAPNSIQFDLTFEPFTTLSAQSAYQLCYTYAPKQTPVFQASDDLEKGPRGAACNPQKNRDGVPAIKAGRMLAVVVQSQISCDALSAKNYVLSVNKQSISPKVPTPLRSTTGNVVAKPGTSRAEGGPEVCYVVFPDPLTADTLTTVSIESSGEKPLPISKVALPSIHTYYNFGVSTGVAVSSIRVKTFGYTGTTTVFHSTTVSEPVLVEPVLFLTYYPGKGIDPETPGKISVGNMGFVAGLSEKAPTSSFYLGVSIEPIRNISFIAGVNASQQAELASGVIDVGPTAMHSSPPTKNVYRGGAFISVAFNFSNFLQQVFK